MDKIVARLRENAKKDPKKIIFPEAQDSRVVEAVEYIKKEKIAHPLLLTPDNLEPEKQEEFANIFYERKQVKGVTLEEARETMENPLYYAAMMTRLGYADGFVAGAVCTTSAVIRAAINLLEIDKTLGLVSSCFIMSAPDSDFGEKGIMFFADCGVIPDPSPRQLANIALCTSELAQKLLGITPRVAMLSYSTKGSAEGKFIEKMREATFLAEQIDPDLVVDGELQVDAAIVPEVSKIKYPGSLLGGKANVLIFPDLESGNISYKLVQRLACARAVGPIILGLNKPCSDLSRGCSVEDIVDCVAVTAIRAQD